MSVATDEARKSLQAFTPVDSTTALNTANQTYDVGGSQTRLSALKGLVGNLQSSVEAVDPSVTGRTSGTFTTEGQRQALVSKERAPVLSDLSKQQGAYSNEQGTLNQKQGLASQMAAALLSDDKTKYQRLLDQYNMSTAQDTADEQKTQHDAALAEQKRQFDLQLAQPKAGQAAATKTPKVTVGSLFDGYNPKTDKNYTEKVVIPTLMSELGYDKEKAAKIAYQYRKSVFGE